MNQREEKRAQMLMETLEALKLSETNRVMADQYLALGKKEFLEKVQKQDLYTLEEAARQKSADYVGFCDREAFGEALERYIRFLAAVGGSTLYYLLKDQLYIGLKWLSSAQEAALLAEQAAWEEGRLNRESLLLLFALGEKRPRSLREALRLCHRKGYNVQILLIGLYLYYVKPKHMASGRTFGETEHAKELSERLSRVLTGSLPLLLPGDRVSAEDTEALKAYVEQSDPSDTFPDRFRTLFRGRKFSGYLLKLLSGAAFLAIEHSDRFLVILRILMAMDPEMVLTSCLDLGGRVWFQGHQEQLEEVFPVPMERYIRWCVSRRMEDVLTRISVRHPEAVQIAAAALSAEDYQYLMKCMKAENASVHQGLNLAFSGVSRIRQAGELSAHYALGKAEAKRYLLGSAGVEAILPFVPKWREMDQWIRWDYEGTRSRLIGELQKDALHRQMYQRAVVLEGLCWNVMYFLHHTGGHGEETFRGMKEGEFLEILQIFEAEKVPVGYQTDLLERICSEIPCSPEGKKRTADACVQALIRKKEEWGAWYMTGLLDGSVFFRALCIRVLGSFGEEYKEVLLPCAMDSSIQVRNVLLEVCTAHREWEADIHALLASSRAQERELAVQVLMNWGADTYRKELKKALAAEKSGKIRELLKQGLGEESGPDPDELVKKLSRGSRKKKVSWAYEGMPAVHRRDGSEASGDELAALLLCYAEQKKPGVSPEAVLLAERLDERELAFDMKFLLERWIDTDADSRRKWVLYPAAVHGGEAIVPLFGTMIRELMEKNRRFMAAEAVRALALNQSPSACSFVEEMAERCRYPQVREAALEASADPGNTDRD